MKSLILMLQFLTRIPIPLSIDMDQKTISRGLFFFPFVGMLIGCVSWVVYSVFGFLSRDLAALGAVMGAVMVTGGLHVDGLADTCDGFFSNRPREKVLEIMKDSRTGTFGVIAVVFDILVRYSVIRALPRDTVLPALVLIFGASRLGDAMMITFGKGARPGGLGEMFSSASGRTVFFLSFAVYCLLSVWIGGWSFLICLAAMLLFCLTLMGYSGRKIGGLTGDVYGAGIELSEIVGLLVFLGVETWI